MLFVLLKNNEIVEIVSEKFVHSSFVANCLSSGIADEVKKFDSVEDLKLFLVKKDATDTVNKIEHFINDVCKNVTNKFTEFVTDIENKLGMPSNSIKDANQLLESAKFFGESLLNELRKTVKKD